MNVFTGGKTSTSVHSTQAAQGQRRGEALGNHYTLSACLMYVQVVIGLALVVYQRVSTPGYISVLLLLLPMAGLYYLSCRISAAEGAAASLPGRIGEGLLFGCLFLDAQLSLYAFVAIVREILPDYSNAVIALVTLLCVVPSLKHQNSHALPSLSRLLKYPLLIGLGLSMLGAYRVGSWDHLFPLLGRGSGQILTGSVWLLSALSAALTPLYIHDQPLDAMSKRRGFRALLLGLLLGAATAFYSAYLLPYYFLARPATLGAQLLLPVKVYPALVSWSVMVCLLMLLLLVSLSASLSRGLHLLSHSIGRTIGTWPAFLLVPLPAFSTDIARRMAGNLAQVRIGCMAGALLLFAAACFCKKRRKRP